MIYIIDRILFKVEEEIIMLFDFMSIWGVNVVSM